MNTQEAIERIKNIDTLNINDMIAGQQVDMVIKNQVLDIISQIDETQKVVVPKFVAEWIEEGKRSGWHLQKALSNLDDDEKVGDWVYDENDDLVSEKVDTFARAWLDGYEIEKEKQWVVKDDTGYLSYLQFSTHNIFERETSLDKNDAYKFKSKSKADLFANLVTGTVEEVTDETE